MHQNFTNEAELVKAIRENRPEAFKYLRENSYPSVRKLVKKNHGTNEDVEDVYIEGECCLLEMLSDPDYIIENKVSTLFIQTCKYHWISVIRKRSKDRKYKGTLKEEVEEGTMEETLDQAVYKSIFWNSFVQIKEECQEILRYVFDEMKLKVIAEKMNISYENLKKKKQRCEKELHEIIYANPDYAVIRKNDPL